MTSLSRAFLAVVPPPGARDAIAARIRAVRDLPVAPGVRWVARDQWHVTLRFCGRVPDADALVAAVTAATAGLGPVGGLRFAGAGAFPAPRRASVVWLGLAADAATAALGGVAAATEAACVAAGLGADDRPFHPHVTVARSSRARDLRAIVAGLGAEPAGPPWTATDVRLVTSETRPGGAVHAEVAAFALGG